MNPQHERLNERIEHAMRLLSSNESQGTGAFPDQPETDEAEVEALLDLVQQLHTAPQLRVDAHFADTLERRVLQQALSSRQQTAHGRLRTVVRVRPQVWAAIISLGVLCALLGVGILALVRPTTNPPHLRVLPTSSEQPQQAQATPTTSPREQAMMYLQATRTDLHTLLGLANPSQTSAYLQKLTQFDTHLTSTTNAIRALPTGAPKTSLNSQLNDLKNAARQELRGILSTLASSASAATTAELGQLGEQVPQVSSATIVLPAHAQGTATISLTGSGIQTGAQLLVDGKHLAVTGTFQNGQVIFVLPWKGKQHPHSLGILNPDGTVAQTQNVTVKTATTSGNGNGNGNGK